MPIGGCGKEDRISSIFLSKKLAKSSGQREVVGGWGGGLRRDEKVSNSFLGLEAEVWIFAEKKAALAVDREEEKV